MSDDKKEPNPEVEREKRRLERLRLISVVTLPQSSEAEDEPRPAA